MNIQEKIKNYCSANKELKDADIILLKHGRNHDVFLLKTSGNKYAAHVGRGERDSGSVLSNSFISLKYLEEKCIDFVPRIISFDNNEDILVETYVGEEHIKFSNLNEKFLDTFVKQLTTIHSLDHKDFQKFCEEEGYAKPKIQMPLDEIQTFGIDRFEIVKRLCADKVVIDWIEPKLKENILLLETIVGAQTPILIHGDIGNNTRIENQKIWMIDWEFSRISYWHELAYIKIHSHPSQDQFTYLVKKYSHYSGLSTDDLYKEINVEEKVTRANDVIWAAMKWGENKDNEEVTKYKNLTHKRMKLYENFIKFSNNDPDR